MTSAPATLAAAHAAAHSAIPSPLTVAVAVAAVAYVLWSRMKGQPLQAKRLLVLPVVLTVLGITDLTGSSAPHLTAKDMAFLVLSAGISAVLGAARGATIELYSRGGELWQRYRPATAALWITLIAARLILIAIAAAAHASAGAGTSTLLLTLGVSLLAETAIVAPRALSTGLPFAADRKDSGNGRHGRAQRPGLDRSPSPGPPGRHPRARRLVRPAGPPADHLLHDRRLPGVADDRRPEHPASGAGRRPAAGTRDHRRRPRATTATGGDPAAAASRTRRGPATRPGPRVSIAELPDIFVAGRETAIRPTTRTSHTPGCARAAIPCPVLTFLP